MSRIALATSAAFDALAPDDRLLADWLRQRQHGVDILVWDRPASWEAYDAVVIRSCWDYHHKPRRFLGWLDRLAQRGVRLINPVALLRHNHDKLYLQDLAARGIPIPATEWLKKGSRVQLAPILEAHGWRQAVVKPRISATAWQTFRTDAGAAAEDQRRFEDLVARQDVIVQEFVDEILDEGEISCVYFAGVRSHAVRKRARPGDYRVQEEFDGSVEPYHPSEALWRQADAVLASVTPTPTYARVDGPVRRGTLIVLELELIEPALYLGTDGGAAERFGRAVLRASAPG